MDRAERGAYRMKGMDGVAYDPSCLRRGASDSDSGQRRLQDDGAE